MAARTAQGPHGSVDRTVRVAELAAPLGAGRSSAGALLSPRSSSRSRRGCGGSPTPTTRLPVDAARRSSRWPSARTCTTCPATRSPCSSSRTASRSRSPTSRQHVIAGVPRRRGQGVLRPPRRQRAQPRPGDAVELRLRRAAAGCLDDHDAGRQERLPRRTRARRALQAAPDPLRRAAREARRPRTQILERYLNTVFFGNNSYGDPGRRRDVLRQDGRRARRSSRRRSSPGSCGRRRGTTRSTTPSAAAPASSRCSTASSTTSTSPRPSADRPGGRTFVLPERVQHDARRAPTSARYYTEALRDYLLNRSDILGDTYEERYNKLFRGGLRIHTTLDPILQAQAEEARNELPRQRRRASTRRSSRSTPTDRGDPGDGRRPGLHGRTSTRSTWRCAPPDRLEHQVLHPRRGAPGRRAARRHHRRRERRARSPNPGNRASRSSSRTPCQRASSTRSPSMTWRVDQLRLRPPVPDRRAQPDGRHRVPHGAVAVPVPGPAGGDRPANADSRAVRQLRDRRQRDEPRSTWRPASRPSPTRACTTSRTTSSTIDDADGQPHLHPLRRRHAGPRPGVALTTVDILKGVLTARHRPQLPARRRPSGLRQDRHAGRQHERLVRRRHARS